MCWCQMQLANLETIFPQFLWQQMVLNVFVDHNALCNMADEIILRVNFSAADHI